MLEKIREEKKMLENIREWNLRKETFVNYLIDMYIGDEK